MKFISILLYYQNGSQFFSLIEGVASLWSETWKGGGGGGGSESCLVLMDVGSWPQVIIADT